MCTAMATDPVKKRPLVTRRRMLTLLAATSGLAITSPLAADSPSPTRWRGTVLGAPAELRLYGRKPAEAEGLIASVLAEVARLERIFTLYSDDSAVVRLNRAGRLDSPPMELVMLLQRARFWSDWSEGAFDATLQPLWALYRDHFAAKDPDPAGPPETAIAAARRLVDYRALEIDAAQVRFLRAGMAVTLNGIAQGYITDRVAALLHSDGMQQVLIDMGEVRALGSAPGPRPWRVGIERPGQSQGVLEVVDRAVATSAPAGTRFDASGRFHHLLDPRSGRPAEGIKSVSVVAKNATDADGLSTALAVAGAKQGLLDQVPATIDRVLVDGIDSHGKS